jgi:hypothetical protein
MNSAIVQFCTEIEQLKSIIEKGLSSTAAQKIWSRWIITHLSFFQQEGISKWMPLPTDGVWDYQLLTELICQGDTQESATRKVAHLQSEATKLALSAPELTVKYDDPSGPDRNSGLHGELEVQSWYDQKNITISCGDYDHHIPHQVYNKIERMYRQTGFGLPNFFHKYLWFNLTLYHILSGPGLQWALPPSVMFTLKQEMGCNTEIFASPINCYYNRYYSLFPHDRYFGSLGNFFQASASEFRSGTYQVNPPFIEPLFVKATDKIIKLLDKAEETCNKLTFIYIMPIWDDFPSYNTLISSKYCHRIIPLESEQHYYYQYQTGQYIKARFGTNIIILSTQNDVCSFAAELKIIHSFQHPGRMI